MQLSTIYCLNIKTHFPGYILNVLKVNSGKSPRPGPASQWLCCVPSKPVQPARQEQTPGHVLGCRRRTQ